ncbi:MAG: tetratricopeptide repeat protein [Calditrichaceae bacterium]
MPISDKKINQLIREENWFELTRYLKTRLRGKSLRASDYRYLELLNEVEKRNMTIPGPEIGIVNALFFDGQNGQCIPVTLDRNPQNDISDDQNFISALENAAEAARYFFRQGWAFELPRYYLKPARIKGFRQHVLHFSGASIGLAAAVILISKQLKQPIPGDAAFSARVDHHGKLSAVDHIVEKTDAVRKNHPFIKRIFLCADPQIDNNKQDDSRHVFCANLDEVVKLLWGEQFFERKVKSIRMNIDRELLELKYFLQIQDNRTAKDILDRFREQYRDSTKPSVRSRYAYVLGELGLQYTHEGRGDKAGEYFREAYDIVRDLGHNHDPAVDIYEVFNKYGVWLTDQFAYQAAENIFTQSLHMLERHHYPDYKYITTRNSLGQLYARWNRNDEARACYEASEKIAEKSGEYDAMARLYCYMAHNETIAGNYAQAHLLLKKAVHETRDEQTEQIFFNDYYKCYTAYFSGSTETLREILTKLENSGRLENPRQFRVHSGIIAAFGASLHDKNAQKRDKLIKLARKWIFGTGSPMISMILVKLEAVERSGGNSMFILTDYEMSEIVRQCQTAMPGYNLILPDVKDIKSGNWGKLKETVHF